MLLWMNERGALEDGDDDEDDDKEKPEPKHTAHQQGITV